MKIINAKTNKSLVCTALLCVAAATPCATAMEQLDRIVAIVEDEAITERQLAKNVRRAQAMLSRQNREMPDQRVLVGQVLQQMIVQQLQLQEAKRLGITTDDITLDRAVAEMAQRNNLSLTEFKNQVENDNRDFQDLRQQIRDELTIRQLVQREVINQIEVSDRETEDVLMSDENRRHSTEYHFAHIRVRPTADATAKQRLALMRQQLRDDSFASLDELRKRLAQLWRTATDKNDPALRYRIKDLGWRHTEDLPAPVRRRIDTIRNKGISPVIANDNGLHLFALLATRSDSPQMMQLQYHVRHILVQTDPIDDDDKVRRKLMSVKRKLRNGADFEALACEYSQDPLSSMKGGDLGWSSPQNYVPEFAEAVTRARKDDIVGPFKTSFGWHLLEVLGTREQDVGDDTMRRQAITEIRKSKSEEETRVWLLRLRENRRIEIRI